MSTKIKFGTDGWRAIIAKDYTVDNVARVAEATAKWIKERNTNNPSIVLGYDCRFGGAMFAETTALVVAAHGVKVIMDKNFVSTPMVSLACKKYGADLGVVITASHNPPSYNGYKLKANFGGPASPKVVGEVEDLIADTTPAIPGSMAELEEKGLVQYVDFEQEYVDHMNAAFDFKSIEDQGLVLAYDAMYGAGQNVVPRVLPNNAVLLHCDYNPGFMGQAPEPIAKNLGELAKLIQNATDVNLGLATDGDADRTGLFDEKGRFVDSHHVILLLIHYLRKYKKLDGKVVIAFSVSNRIKKMCDAYGLDYEVTKIGFKYIAEKMVEEDVLLGGEESGGIAIKGHIPERDGIWNGLVILELMAKTGKSLTELVDEVYEITGAFSYDRNDMHITEELKQSIIQNCKDGKYTSFGPYTVDKVETTDGFKFYIGGDNTVMIRPSGTEPVLRVYSEAGTMDEVQNILTEVGKVLLG